MTDIGNAGPDRGKGGKYLILPPGYEGDISEGYFATQSATYGNWLAVRRFPTGDDNASVVKNIKDHLKIYPLAEKHNPKPVKYHDVSNKYLNTLHAQDITFFHEVNEVVQEEHNEAFSPEVLGMLASIGIEKGKTFNPDARMKKILSEAAVVGTVNADGSVEIYFAPKAPEGHEKNWVPTNPDKGFFLVFRFYGFLEGYINKTWVLNDLELID